MKNYEILFIVRPTLGEDELKKVIANFENILTSNGATIKENNINYFVSNSLPKQAIEMKINSYAAVSASDFAE